jgi:hypothetical protein
VFRRKRIRPWRKARGASIAYPWKEDLAFNGPLIMSFDLIKRAIVFLKAFIELSKEGIFSAATIIFYPLYQFLFLPDTPRPPLWFKRNRWTIFAIAGLAMVPTSLLGRVKAGGGPNTLSFTTYFLLASAILILAQTSMDSSSSRSKDMRDATKLLMVVLVVMFVCIKAPAIFYFQNALQRFLTCDDQQAYEYARRHPGEAYFPQNPLASIMAEGKLYHDTSGLLDREYGGYQVSNEHFRANIPQNVRIVAYKIRYGRDYVLRYLPEFTRKVTVDELPGWVVYTRG